MRQNGAYDANGHHHDSAGPIGGNSWSGRQLMEDRTIEKPMVRIHDPAEKLDQKGPCQNPVDGSRCQAGHDAPRQCSETQKEYPRWHGVQSSAKEVGKADCHMLAGHTKPGENAPKQPGNNNGRRGDAETAQHPSAPRQGTHQEMIDPTGGLLSASRGDLASSHESNEQRDDEKGETEVCLDRTTPAIETPQGLLDPRGGLERLRCLFR